MPRRPPWHARAAEIRSAIAALPVPVLDRVVIERLFGIERRTAQRLLRTLNGHFSAAGALATREDVLLMLDALVARKPIAAEIARKRRLHESLAALREEAVPRTTAVAVVAKPEAGWPEGISLSAPTQLQVEFRTPEELLGRVLALTESAAEDYAGFVRRLAVAVAEPES